MTDAQIEWLDSFNEMIKDISAFLFCTRDADLQREACAKLESALRMIAVDKDTAIEHNDEAFANILLGCECLASAFFAEIRMWILLKDSQPDKAWDELVNAQGAIAAAIRSDDGFSHLNHHVERLDAIEKTVFPPQNFLSTGMIVKEQICGICGGDYEGCPHIKGRPYWGRFCTVRLVPSEVDHVAMVETQQINTVGLSISVSQAEDATR